MPKKLGIIKNRYDVSLEVSCGILIGGMLFVISAQVFCRYVLNSPLVWAEEIARLFFVWVSFVAVVVAVKRKANISIDIFLVKLPVRTRRVWERFIAALCLLFAIFMVVGGFQIARVGWFQPTAALRFPMSFYTLAIPISGILMMADLVIHIVSNSKQSESE
jgi:TRAP-type C4-dicarboxylate transport system permease small subunit